MGARERGSVALGTPLSAGTQPFGDRPCSSTRCRRCGLIGASKSGTVERDAAALWLWCSVALAAVTYHRYYC